MPASLFSKTKQKRLLSYLAYLYTQYTDPVLHLVYIQGAYKMMYVECVTTENKKGSSQRGSKTVSLS